MKAGKFTVKSILVTLLCALLIGIGATPADAVGKQQYVVVYKADINFVVDGEVYHAPKETQAFLYDNRTYVPIRFASYLLEKWVNWNGSTATVSVSIPNATQLKQLQNYKKKHLAPNVDASKPVTNWSKEKIYASVDVAGYNFFGREQPVPKDVTTFMHKGTIYVPLRYFTDLVQHDIKYDGATKSVLMNARNHSDVSNGGNAGSGGNNGSTGGSDGGSTITDPGVGEGVIPGVPGEVTPPTRDEVVAAAKAQLERLESRLATQAYSLYEKYTKATTDEEKQQYIDQAFAAVASADAEVQSIVDQLNKDFEKYGYEIGNDGSSFLSAYKDKKQTMIDQLLK